MIDKYNLKEIQYSLYTIIIIHDPKKQNMFAAFKNSQMTCKILTTIIIIWTVLFIQQSLVVLRACNLLLYM